MPAAHTVQSPLPTSELLYLPSAQSVQTEPDIPFVDVPSAHAVQSADEEEPRWDVNPNGQSMHVAEPAAELAYLPAEHTQALDPRVESIPAGQFEQAAEPAELENLPAGQGVYVVAPTATSSPAAFTGWG